MSIAPENPYQAPLLPDAASAAPTALPPAPRKPRVWTLAVALLAALVLSFGMQIVVSIGAVVYLLANGTSPQRLQEEIMRLVTSPGVFIMLVIIGPGAFGVVALAAAWLSPEPLRERLGLRPVRCSATIYPLSMLASIFLLAIGLALAYALQWVFPNLPVDPSARLLYEQMTPLWALPFVAVIGLVPGFCEELLFRGYIQRRLHARWGPTVAILTASVLFGLAHVMPHVVIFATVLGLWFGVVAWKSGSIWPCIACHFFVNSGLNAWRMVIKFAELPEGVQWGVTIGFVSLGAVCLGAAVWVLFAPQSEESTVA